VVVHPTATKIYPMLSSPIYLIKFGVIKEINKLTSQFKTVAILTDLSCMISAMYNQVIGPDENSNNAMKRSTRIKDGMVQ